MARWQDSVKRRERSATFWKILVASTSAAALSAVLVASCFDAGEARRDRDRTRVEEEPGIVQTTAASLPATAQAQATELASTATAPTAGSTPAPSTTVIIREVVEAPAAPREVLTSAQPTYTPAPAQAAQLAAVPQQAAAQPAPAPPPADVATNSNAVNDVPVNGTATDNSGYGGVATNAPRERVLRDPRGNVVDPDDHGTNPNAPAMSAGAGQFTTDAPPWAASAWKSDPNAGAGPFTTEWNIPGYGYWPY